MKRELLRPIVVLTAICLFITGALAVTNHITAPRIDAANAVREEAARLEVLPQADGFTEVTGDDLPPSVQAAWRADNGAGFVVKLSAMGYKGPIVLLCGVSMDGRITGTKTLMQSETAGVGAKITEDPFRNQFPGKDNALDGVETISGATISSRAYIAAIADAFCALISLEGGICP